MATLKLSSNALLNFFYFILFMPQLALGFSVATPSPWSTEAAIEVLRKGGNATDAMVAASFALNVSQPHSMGIGGGGFYLASKDGKVFFWDHRETAPSSAHEKMFLDEKGEPIPYEPERITGPNPVGIPGTVLGLHEAHQKLGKLAWKTLLEPAIRIAKNGIPISENFEEALKEEWERLSLFPTTSAIFGDREGSYLKAGRVLRQPLLANTLEQIQQKGAKDFYQGNLAKSWTNEAQQLGVKINLDDLKAYKVQKRKPIEFKVFGLTGYTAPPPSASGIMVAAVLRYLEQHYRGRELPSPDSASRVAVTAEAMRYFQKVRNENIADPTTNRLDPQKFLNSPEEKKAWAEIHRNVRKRLDQIETAVTLRNLDAGSTVSQGSFTENGHTAHLSIVDDSGHAVAYTTTIEAWFGSGLAVTGHGFLLNNELSDFNAEPGHPNSAAPGKRPRSNMSPTLLFENQKPVAALGCAGGPRIPTVIVELLENYYLHRMTAREAIAFPRFHYSINDDKLYIEKGFPTSTLQQLKDAGYNVVMGQVGGVAQAVMRRSSKNKWEAAAEPRWDAMAVSWEPIR
ncbi:MAG: gamma-glutamyltransferase [Bdellovibrionota bacterium]